MSNADGGRCFLYLAHYSGLFFVLDIVIASNHAPVCWYCDLPPTSLKRVRSLSWTKSISANGLSQITGNGGDVGGGSMGGVSSGLASGVKLNELTPGAEASGVLGLHCYLRRFRESGNSAVGTALKNVSVERGGTLRGP